MRCADTESQPTPHHYSLFVSTSPGAASQKSSRQSRLFFSQVCLALIGADFEIPGESGGKAFVMRSFR